jgi:hypothetical protein
MNFPYSAALPPRLNRASVEGYSSTRCSVRFQPQSLAQSRKLDKSLSGFIDSQSSPLMWSGAIEKILPVVQIENRKPAVLVFLVFRRQIDQDIAILCEEA